MAGTEQDVATAEASVRVNTSGSPGAADAGKLVTGQLSQRSMPAVRDPACVDAHRRLGRWRRPAAVPHVVA